MHRRLAVLSLLALAPCSIHAAEPVSFCGAAAPPLLYATSSTHPAAFSTITFNRTLYILQGGVTVLVTTPRFLTTNLPFSTDVIIGHADPGAYSELVKAMAAVKVGFQDDCHKLPLEVNLTEEQTRFTWFGRGRRQNTFVATNLRPDLPPCPSTMDRLVTALDSYALALRKLQSLQAPPPDPPR